MANSAAMFYKHTHDTKPWTKCFPAPPEDFVWEDFSAFLPVIAGVFALVSIFTLYFGRRHSLFDKFILVRPDLKGGKERKSFPRARALFPDTHHALVVLLSST
jgi:hypothetical protein